MRRDNFRKNTGTCSKCKSTNVKARRNYPHGVKGKAVVSLICKSCGSRDVRKYVPERRQR